MKSCCQQQDKSYRKEKLLSAAEQIVSQCIESCESFQCADAKSRCLDKSDRIAKSRQPVGQIVL